MAATLSLSLGLVVRIKAAPYRLQQKAFGVCDLLSEERSLLGRSRENSHFRFRDLKNGIGVKL